MANENISKIIKGGARRRVINSINSVCQSKYRFYQQSDDGALSEAIYSKIRNKNPKSILLVDDLGPIFLDKLDGVKITLALTSARVPESKFDAVKRKLWKYYRSIGRDVEIIRLDELLEDQA